MKIIKQFIWLLKIILKNQKKIYILYFFIAFLNTVLPIAVSYFQKLFINYVQGAYLNKMTLTIIIILAGYIVLKLVNSIYKYIDSYFAHMFIQKTNFNFNKYLTFALYKEKQKSFYDTEFNDRINRVQEGYKVIPYHIFSINEVIILILVIAFIQLPVIVLNSPWLLVFIGINVIFPLLYSGRFAKKEYNLKYDLTREQRKESYYGNVTVSKVHAKELRVYWYATNIY
jgi:ABC-type bacteriocin/lantibiotic exporter with double-glycine peptidase domain